MNRRRLAAALFAYTLFGLPCPRGFAAPYERPELTVRVLPAQPYVQQQVVQSVSLVSLHPFEALDVTLPDVDGARVVTVVTPNVRRFHNYGLEGYAYRVVRAIFPERSGPLDLGAVRIDGEIGLKGQPDVAFRRRGDPITLDVEPIPSRFDAPVWLVARRIGIDERFSQPLHTVRGGETLERRVALTAEGVLAEQLPDLRHPAVPGLQVFTGPVTRDTEHTDDGVVGHLTQSFAIRFDTSDPVTLPSVGIDWWDGRARDARRSATPLHRVEPLPADVAQRVASAMAEARARHARQRASLIGVGVAAAGLLLGGGAWLVLSLLHARPADRRLRRALRHGRGPAAVLGAVDAWRREAEAGAAASRAARARLLPIESAVYADGARHRPVSRGDRRAIARQLIREARCERRRALSQRLRARIRRWFGSQRSLPVID